MSSLASAQIENLVHTILGGSTIERPSALFELIKAVCDPEGDKDRYESALDALRATDPLTQEYEAWFQGRTASPVKSERVSV